MRRLVLLRHGRTAWNDTGRAQGHADVPLDDVGLAQAKEVAPLMAGLAPIAIWTSDLARAAQTADAVAAECGLEAVRDPRLREFDIGPNRTGLTSDEYAEQFPDEYAALLAGDIAGIPGRESRDDVLARFVPALTSYVDTLGEGETGAGRLPRRRPARRRTCLPRLGRRPRRVLRRARQLRLDRARALRLDVDRRRRAVAAHRLEPHRLTPISPAPVSPIMFSAVGGVAQLVAHLHGMQRVRGSSPLTSTNERPGALHRASCILP